MANEYYNPSGNPATLSFGQSAAIRAEFQSIAAGFALLPGLAANPNKAVVINAAGNGMVAVPQGFQLVDSVNPSGAASYIKNGLGTTYTTLILQYDLLPVTNAVDLQFNAYDSGGVLFNNWYGASSRMVSSFAGSWPSSGTSAFSFVKTNNTAVQNSTTFGGISGEIYFLGLNSSTYKKGFARASYFTAAGTFETNVIGFGTANVSTSSGVQLAFSSGNISSGTIRLFGMI